MRDQEAAREDRGWPLCPYRDERDRLCERVFPHDGEHIFDRVVTR